MPLRQRAASPFEHGLRAFIANTGCQGQRSGLTRVPATCISRSGRVGPPRSAALNGLRRRQAVCAPRLGRASRAPRRS
jgi:hypothetical protein